MKADKSILNKKATGKIGNQVIEGMIYDYTTNGEKIWIETEEDIYCVNGDTVTIIEEKQVKKEKASANVIFGKYEHKDCFDEVLYRKMTIDIQLTAQTKEGVESLWEVFSKRLEEEAEIDIEWSTCAEVDENKNGTWRYLDFFLVDFEYGEMTYIKNDFMKVFKKVKRELEIR